jgi:bacterioferritin-associated ferredoxin
MSKIVSAIIANQLDQYLQTHGLKEQAGFMSDCAGCPHASAQNLRAHRQEAHAVC